MRPAETPERSERQQRTQTWLIGLRERSASAVSASGRSVAGGDQLCWADFQLLYALDYSCELLGEGVLHTAPLCAALRAALRALPRMAAFYASGAKPLVTPQYIREVREAQLPRE